MQPARIHPSHIHIPGVGQMLIQLRASLKVPASNLAAALGTTEDAVLRDEANDYPDLTVERAHRILAAFDTLKRRH